MNPNDLELDIDNAEIVKEGRGWFAQRCAFCHGGDGIGGKGPCLTCGKFKYSGNTNADILTTISIGVPKSRVVPWEHLEHQCQLKQLLLL